MPALAVLRGLFSDKLRTNVVAGATAHLYYAESTDASNSSQREFGNRLVTFIRKDDIGELLSPAACSRSLTLPDASAPGMPLLQPFRPTS